MNGSVRQLLLGLMPVDPAVCASKKSDAPRAVPPEAISSVDQGHTQPDAVKLELKGTTIPVIAVLIPMRLLAQLEAALEAKVGGARAFFEGEPAVLDVSRCYAAREAAAADEAAAVDEAAKAEGAATSDQAGGGRHDAASSGEIDDNERDDNERGAGVSSEPDGAEGASAGAAPAGAGEGIDYDALVALVRRYGLTPVAVRGAPESAAEAIRAAGLAIVAGVAAPRSRVDADAAMVAPVAAPVIDQPAPSPTIAEPETIGALVVDKAMRSGQRVYAKGRDLVVLAQVNPGAELIADGSIHCYAPLRGRAVAGASGNAKATIFASNFQAELVSIAGVYKTFETIPAEVRGRQMCVRLREQDGASRIALDPINTE